MDDATRGMTLADLIRREQDTTGASYMDIAKRSGLSKAKVGQLALPNSTYQVRPDTVKKLADGLRLPLHVVQRAAMTTAGMTDSRTTSSVAEIELICSQLERLDDNTLDVIAAMVDAAVRKTENG